MVRDRAVREWVGRMVVVQDPAVRVGPVVHLPAVDGRTSSSSKLEKFSGNAKAGYELKQLWPAFSILGKRENPSAQSDNRCLKFAARDIRDQRQTEPRAKCRSAARLDNQKFDTAFPCSPLSFERR